MFADTHDALRRWSQKPPVSPSVRFSVSRVVVLTACLCCAACLPDPQVIAPAAPRASAGGEGETLLVSAELRRTVEFVLDSIAPAPGASRVATVSPLRIEFRRPAGTDTILRVSVAPVADLSRAVPVAGAERAATSDRMQDFMARTREYLAASRERARDVGVDDVRMQRRAAPTPVPALATIRIDTSVRTLPDGGRRLRISQWIAIDDRDELEASVVDRLLDQMGTARVIVRTELRDIRIGESRREP